MNNESNTPQQESKLNMSDEIKLSEADEKIPSVDKKKRKKIIVFFVGWLTGFTLMSLLFRFLMEVTGT